MKKAAKILGLVFLAVIPLSFLIIILYDSAGLRLDIDNLARQEDASRYQIPKEKFQFRAYPSQDNEFLIEWGKDENDPGGQAVRMIFKNDGITRYLGMRFHFTLVLKGVVERSYLKFRLKRKNGWDLPADLRLYLEDINGIRFLVFLPFKNNSEWQDYILPVSNFAPQDNRGPEKRNFSWEIREILFSLVPAQGRSAEFILEDFKIITDNMVNYEII